MLIGEQIITYRRGLKSQNHINDEVEDHEFNLITYAKAPNLIQEEPYYFENLKKDNFNFFIQIDEDFYTDTTLKGSYIFAYGALYLFKQKQTGEIIAGFWQH